MSGPIKTTKKMPRSKFSLDYDADTNEFTLYADFASLDEYDQYCFEHPRARRRSLNGVSRYCVVLTKEN